MPTANLLTDRAAIPGSYLGNGFRRDTIEPLGWGGPRVTEWEDTNADTGRLTSTLRQKLKVASPSPHGRLNLSVDADSIPIQIWEGTVIDVNQDAKIMHVYLEAKIGEIPRHTADIELEWVSEQDQDLVGPGAIFYLTLFKRTKSGSIENSQELRFRRRPSWSATQIRDIRQAADVALANMVALPEAE